MTHQGTCRKCQETDIEVRNGLCDPCWKALDAWEGQPHLGNRVRPRRRDGSLGQLGDALGEDLAAEGELTRLRTAGRR